MALGEPWNDDALALCAALAAVDDEDALWRALDAGLRVLWKGEFVVASFHFHDDVPARMWRGAPAPERSPEWWARNAAMHPAPAWLAQHPGVLVGTVSDVLDDDALAAHPYYREFMEPEGWFYSLAWFFWQGGEWAGLVALNRARADGDFTPADRALALSLHPIVDAAFRRLAARAAARDARAAYEELLAQLPVPLLLYSRRERSVLFANRACRDALARWNGTSSKKRARVSARSLGETLRRACDDAGRAGLELLHADGAQRVTVRSVNDPGHPVGEPLALVVFDEQRMERPPSAAWLAASTQLTAHEREVAALAAAGLTNAEIGRQLGKSAFTVKRQIAAVLAKTRVRGRAALAALYGGATATRSTRRRARV